MSDAEENDAEKALEESLSLDSYKACFIFTSTRHNKDERPNKRRKVSGVNSDAKAWPSLRVKSSGADPTYQTRCDQYGKAWPSLQIQIDNVINRVDDVVRKQLNAFIKTDGRATARLKTALVLTDSVSLDKKALLATGPADGSTVTVRLHARQCSNLQTALRNLIRLAVTEYGGSAAFKSHLEKHKRLIPLAYDLELLQLYMNDAGIKQINLVIRDIENLDNTTINDLVTILWAWRTKIRVVLLLEIASTPSLFESRLSPGTLRVIEAEVFDFRSRTSILSDIVRLVQTGSGPMLSPGLISQIQSVAGSQTLQPTTLQSMMRYSCMSHFFANSLSSFLSDHGENNVDTERNEYYANTIRTLPSFRAHCESLLSTNSPKSAKEIRAILEDNGHTVSTARAHATKAREQYAQVCSSISAMADLYTVLDLQMTKTLTSAASSTIQHRNKLDLEVELYQSLHDLTDCDLFEEIETSLSAMNEQEAFSRLNKLPRGTLDVLGIADVSQYQHEVLSSPQDSANNTTQMNGHSNDSQDSTIVNTQSSRKKPSASRGKKRKTAGEAHDHVVTPSSEAPSDAVSSLVATLRSHMAEISFDPTTTLAHETWLLTPRTVRLKAAFEPQPRAAIERALLKPADYLDFDIGARPAANNEDEDNSPSPIDLPATSVLYTLLQEAPVTINLRDLFDAFCTRLAGQRIMDEEDSEEDEARQQRAKIEFYKALASFRMLGLVKGSTAQTVRKASGGKGRGRGAGEVDFIAKTSWAGL